MVMSSTKSVDSPVGACYNDVDGSVIIYADTGAGKPIPSILFAHITFTLPICLSVFFDTTLEST